MDNTNVLEPASDCYEALTQAQNADKSHDSSWEREDFCPHCKNKMRLARAVVPKQKLESLFSPEQGLKHGTIFPELHMPYVEGEWR